MSRGTQPTGTPLSVGAEGFVAQLRTFTEETPGVQDAVVVSADGQLMARSSCGSQPPSGHLAAAVSGIAGLADGAARAYQLGTLNTVIIDTTLGYLLVSVMDGPAALGVAASKSSTISAVAYGMTQFAHRSGPVLTPQVVNELAEWSRRNTVAGQPASLTPASASTARPGLPRPAV